ncbi:MAG TPA: hypothetical protein VN240_11590 [Propylenella sp.]|nr:hypothetical protein [Propylenella sp.]
MIGVASKRLSLSPAAAQYSLAGVFFVLGGWCLVAPDSVMTLAFRPEYHSSDRLVSFLLGGFGAQALIAGLFAAFSVFTRRTFAAYGVALLPFFVFDYWFYFVEPILTPIGLLDAAGNVVMLTLCWIGWRSRPDQV